MGLVCNEDIGVVLGLVPDASARTITMQLSQTGDGSCN